LSVLCEDTSSVVSYLRTCEKQQDILVFGSPEEASKAARILRRRFADDCTVKASYHKVFLQLRDGKYERD